MKSRPSKLGQLAVLLILGGILFAGSLGSAWPWVIGAGVLIIACRALLALIRFLEG